MTTQSNAEIREVILWAIKYQFEGLDCSHLGHKDEEAATLPNQALEEATDDVVALFQSQQRQLLQGLMEQKQKYYKQVAGKPYATNGFKGSTNIYYESGHEAIPLLVIQNKLEGLS